MYLINRTKLKWILNFTMLQICWGSKIFWSWLNLKISVQKFLADINILSSTVFGHWLYQITFINWNNNYKIKNKYFNIWFRTNVWPAFHHFPTLHHTFFRISKYSMPMVYINLIFTFISINVKKWISFKLHIFIFENEYLININEILV